jgi:hypothetical protein
VVRVSSTATKVPMRPGSTNRTYPHGDPALLVVSLKIDESTRGPMIGEREQKHCKSIYEVSDQTPHKIEWPCGTFGR